VASSRKRKKEFKRLKGEADTLLQSQKEVLEHAGYLAREASRQAGNYAREEVGPRVRGTYDHKVRPVVDTGLSVTKSAAHTAREKVTDGVIPAVSTALGAAVATLDSKSSGARKVVAEATRTASKAAEKAAEKAGTKIGVVKPKSAGPGKYILIGLAVVAIAGVAYAAWQTMRADDDLWIDDEVDEADVETPQDIPPVEI
jgi:hypothetical protein